MYNIILYSPTSFQLSTTLSASVLPRAYDTKLNRANHIIIKNVKNGASIDLGLLSNVTIDDIPATFEGIRRIVFNLSCECDDGGISPPLKIFDFTFGNTFE